MRKSILFLLLMVCLTASAQNSDGKRPVYCNIMGYNFWGFGKVKVQLDMGDYAYHNGDSYDSIYEENGKKKKFNTMMEVLNFMGERGWKVIGTYYITESPRHHVIHYLMEKWIEDESERKAGLILKEDNDPPKEIIDDSYYTPKRKEKN